MVEGAGVVGGDERERDTGPPDSQGPLSDTFCHFVIYNLFIHLSNRRTHLLPLPFLISLFLSSLVLICCSIFLVLLLLLLYIYPALILVLEKKKEKKKKEKDLMDGDERNGFKGKAPFQYSRKRVDVHGIPPSDNPEGYHHSLHF